MNAEWTQAFDDATRNALVELKGMIVARYPDASLEVSHGEDPEGVYLKATVDVEDVDEVLDVVLDKLSAVQVEQGLPIYVIPLQPVERVLRDLRSPRRRSRPHIDWVARTA
ncbi:MAG: hypothetical protein HY673_22640 [Chloroflexi bacterium]|nr:hypothetical protein [Chloroflexota bacterium]